MSAKSRGCRAAALVIKSRPRATICTECISSLQRRSYAIAATSLKTSSPEPNSSLPHLQQSIAPMTHSPSQYKTKTGILLTRPPLLTRPLSSFEKAFFFYQKRMNERLSMPFTRYFYFKKDTPADTDYKIKARERNGVAARELGGYNAYGEFGWNDELLVKDKAMAETKYVVESLIRDSKVRAVEGKDGAAVEVKEGDVVERGEEGKVLGRRTESDRKGDVRRLDRALERTLYLVVKRTGGGWGFPSGEIVGRENLHQAAERILVQTAGLNMNTWIVGHVPIGHHISKPILSKEDSSLIHAGEKTFFMKGRIMAGQANIKGNMFGLEDFKWLTREEVEKHVGLKYWSSVRNMLSER